MSGKYLDRGGFVAIDTESGAVMKLECVIDAEPNPAFKSSNLSPFPTAIFEVASARYRTALIRLADLRIIFSVL